jgi:MtaA/CmuA family methyltransferase
MRGQTPDRVPVVPLIDTSYAAACYGVPVSECFLDPEVHARALLSCLERHPDIDGLSINIGIAPEVVRERVRTPAGWLVTTLDGSVWQVPLDDIGTPVRHDITCFEDVRLQTLDILRPHVIETLHHIPADVLARYNISVGLTGPFSQVGFMMGVQRVLIAMIDQPEELQAAIACRTPFALVWAEQVAALGSPSVWIGEGMASGSLISSAHYASFVLPSEQQVMRRLRELGVPSALHICGRADNLLDEMARSGADCFEIDWQVDLKVAKSRIGSGVSLKGNLHTSKLAQSTPAEVYEDSGCAIQATGPGGGFILSSGCALGRDTPPGNIDAMARAARDFGVHSRHQEARARSS